MRKLILKVSGKWDKNIVTYSLEKGITSFFADEQYVSKIRELAKVEIISSAENADFIIGKNIFYTEIKDKSDEIKTVELAKSAPVIIQLPNWKIIPIENILAQTDNIIVEISSFEEAELCAGILEKGVKSFVLNVSDIEEIGKIADFLTKLEYSFNLSDAEITDVKTLPITDRVCIDSCVMMTKGQGFLIGSSSQCLFLVHSESVENPYVATRPFRVNAGAVHSYIMLTNNKTKYLSELRSGDELLTVSADGSASVNVVGRIKFEKRPMLLIKAVYKNIEFSVVLQNAETVNLTDHTGSPVSVSKLKTGDKIKCYFEEHGRHFGMSIKETIKEI